MNNKHLLHEIDDILENISIAVDAERSSFFLLNEDSQELESIVAQGVENTIIGIPVGNGIIGWVVEQGQPLIVNNVREHHLFDRSYDLKLNFVTKSAACVPVFNDMGQAIGAIQCLNKVNGLFKEKDILILNGFAVSVSLIVKNSQLYYVSEQIKNNFSTLLNVFAAISSELDLDNLIQLIMVKATEITQADRSSLFFMDDEKGELWTKYAKGLEKEIVRTNKGIVGLVAQNKRAYIVNKPYEHPCFDPTIDLKTGYKTESIMGVPVFNAEKQVLGVIQVINKIDGSFKMKDLSILNGFACQISIAIENARLFEQILGMKNYLNILVENLDNGIVTVDKYRRVQTINNTFYKMFDIDQHKSFHNKQIDSLDNDLYDILKYSNQTILSGKKHYEYGIEICTEKSKKVAMNLSILPMQSLNGDIIGAINVFHDITKEKRIRSNLSRYIPQHLVNEVINKDELSMLKGKYGKCSMLFSDIRDFTTLTEELGAIQIVELLNKYFNSMVNSIHTHKGILDKFIGDAIMAVFGVPYTSKTDASNAVRCALDMFKMLDELNNGNHTNHIINIGIGISTGHVVSGNIGSEKRFEYTVIGDPVNLAARLESATKDYKLKLLICETTCKHIASEFHCREIDTVLVKGKNKPVKIYTVIGQKDQPLSKDYMEFCNYFQEGLGHYRNKDFKHAQRKFKLANAIDPNDGPTQLFLNRCNHLMINSSCD